MSHSSSWAVASCSWPSTVTAVIMFWLATRVVMATGDSRDGDDYTTPSPPLLVQSATAEKAYKVGDTVTLPCEARGFPPPIYEWLKNGEKLNVLSTSDVRQVPGLGTIEITMHDSRHDGVYQCLAYNKLGTAVSLKTQLRQATLDPFPTIKEPKVHRPGIGSPLTLTCQPPMSYPVGTVYWGETKNGPKLRPIENTKRISLDYDGSLHFSNINESDHRSSAHYVCVVYNAELRNIVEGDDQKIEPLKLTDTPRYDPPRLMWSSVASDIAIKGQTKKMKCIFSGFPTPTVRWARLDGPMPAKNNLESSFGQELIIPDADFSDSGRYQCTAANSAANPASKNFTLKVESTPYWRDDRRPESIDTSEDEDAAFECNVNGFPKPTITWTVNGKSLDEVRNPRRSLEMSGNKLVFRGVLKSDAQVVQCNASNPHGYIFANAYLNVLAEPPSFREAPRPMLKAALGRSATLTCRVFGAPKPTIVWQKGSRLEAVDDYFDRRYTSLANGDLEIQNINENDNDTYQCYVCNKFGCEARSGLLLVIAPTVIVNPPSFHQQATAGSNLTLYCNATTDESETSQLRVEWRRGDVALATDSGRRGDGQDDNDVVSYNNGAIVIGDSGRRLTIVGVKVEDTGRYTCHAENGVDSDTADVHVTVRDRPEPPTDIRLNSCQPTYADISWSSGADNNDPITGYVIYFSTANDAELSVSGGAGGQSSSPSNPTLNEAMRVDAGKQSVRVRNLAPWNEYTFFVAAINSVGQSDAAKVTSSSIEEGIGTDGSSLLTCSTPESKPARSPNKVCTDSRKPDHLVIVWEPMLRSEHHGLGFHYVVTYQRLDLANAEVLSKVINDWRQSELEILNTPTYTEYKVSVQAKNNQGAADPSNMIGHSGEDVPLEIPQNFQLVKDSLNATSAAFTWEPVDRSLAVIRGFFKGYQIRFWRTDNPSVYRTEDVILRQWKPCRPSPDSGVRLGRSPDSELDPVRTRRSASGGGRSGRVRGATTNLWPFSSITAAVVVLNGARTGELSETVTFQTPEGVPGPVRHLAVVERGSHHLKLSWQQPIEINGILTGYDIRYKEVSSDGAVWETAVTNTTQTTKKIHELNHSASYVLTVCAMTREGRGVETTVHANTIRASPPDAPSIENIDIGYDFMLVNWQPSDRSTDSNPASEFIVEFREEGSTDWTSIGPERDHSSINITDLKYGQHYEVRVIGRNQQYPTGVMSKTAKIVVGYQPAAEIRDTAVASSSWFILLICLLSLMLLVLLVVGLFRYNRGGKYPVFEKERQHGTNGGHIEEEDRFCEFVRSEDPAKRKSQGSLETSSRSEEDEDGSDSLGIYEDGDPAKFNEDGSFVDQSGYKKIIDGQARLPQSPMMIVTATSPKSTPHTFV